MAMLRNRIHQLIVTINVQQRMYSSMLALAAAPQQWQVANRVARRCGNAM